MPDRQRILLVSTAATASETQEIRGTLGRDALVLTAPTADAKRVVTAIGAEPRAELELAPVRFPDADRGHRLDALVRRHALADRFRDVVVVADAATLTLLLRVLAPDQLPAQGAVTTVGLPRAGRPVPVAPAVGIGVVIGVLAGLLAGGVPILALPAVTVVVGLGVAVVPSRRHLGLGALLAAAVALGVLFLSIAGSSRFPGSW